MWAATVDTDRNWIMVASIVKNVDCNPQRWGIIIAFPMPVSVVHHCNVSFTHFVSCAWDGNICYRYAGSEKKCGWNIFQGFSGILRWNQSAFFKRDYLDEIGHNGILARLCCSYLFTDCESALEFLQESGLLIDDSNMMLHTAEHNFKMPVAVQENTGKKQYVCFTSQRACVTFCRE
jgi:hypothetical protein